MHEGRSVVNYLKSNICKESWAQGELNCHEVVTGVSDDSTEVWSWDGFSEMPLNWSKGAGLCTHL